MIERRFLGVVEVDSGTLIVGNPTYLLASRRDGRPGIDYDEVVRSNVSDVATRLAGHPSCS